MNTEKAGGYISQITFNNGESLDILQNDIVVFVGPNNAGKSQSLKDIYALSEMKRSTVVITDIKTTKYDASILSALTKAATGENHGDFTIFRILGRGVNFRKFSDKQFQEEPYFGEYRDLFVANLDTSARLIICSPPGNIGRNGNKAHPIHYAAFDGRYRKWLSDSFKRAFDIEVTPNTQYGALIPLCMGKPVILTGEYEDEQSRQEKYAEILETYKQVQDQGDGIKSFAGILLYLMLDYYCTYLIDEPESFLHPPQARIMGQIIGQTLSEHQQAFISTHSEEIIKGLLEVCPDRIKVIRITREEDNNKFSILNNHEFQQVWSDPLLRYSNIMASLFHQSVVLCESDSDCKVYSIIENYIKQKKGKYSETLFIHCGGKHRMAKVITALRSLNIEAKLIVDIDVLNDETVFKGIVSACGVDYSAIRTAYTDIVSNLHSSKEIVKRAIAKAAINQILDNGKSTNLTNREIKDIREAIATTSKWDGIKHAGVSAIPSGNATASFRMMDQLLRKNDIFIVPVGELECFVKEVGGHGPDWANAVLEAYPNLDDSVYVPIIKFIESMNL